MTKGVWECFSPFFLNANTYGMKSSPSRNNGEPARTFPGNYTFPTAGNFLLYTASRACSFDYCACLFPPFLATRSRIMDDIPGKLLNPETTDMMYSGVMTCEQEISNSTVNFPCAHRRGFRNSPDFLEHTLNTKVELHV